MIDYRTMRVDDIEQDILWLSRALQLLVKEMGEAPACTFTGGFRIYPVK